jgi:hypothetical protein
MAAGLTPIRMTGSSRVHVERWVTRLALARLKAGHFVAKQKNTKA